MKNNDTAIFEETEKMLDNTAKNLQSLAKCFKEPEKAVLTVCTNEFTIAKHIMAVLETDEEVEKYVKRFDAVLDSDVMRSVLEVSYRAALTRFVLASKEHLDTNKPDFSKCFIKEQMKKIAELSLDLHGQFASLAAEKGEFDKETVN